MPRAGTRKQVAPMPLTDEQVRQAVRSVPHWYHRITLRPGIVTPGVSDSVENLRRLQLPADCRGARALDLGARDGFFSFELERRGAEAVAVDYLPAERTGFRVAADALGSRVRYLHANLYDLPEARLGQFDIVLFLGLFYHLPDPLLALRIIRSHCRGLLFLESHVVEDGSDVPLMRFYPGRSLNNDPTNYWGPNLACLEAMLSESRFQALSRACYGDRAVFRCRAREDQALAYFNRLATARRACA
jgi:tRNA (mo5U34)-methyltransferase